VCSRDSSNLHQAATLAIQHTLEHTVNIQIQILKLRLNAILLLSLLASIDEYSRHTRHPQLLPKPTQQQEAEYHYCHKCCSDEKVRRT
jgi:hypothetical protein